MHILGYLILVYYIHDYMNFQFNNDVGLRLRVHPLTVYFFESMTAQLFLNGFWLNFYIEINHHEQNSITVIMHAPMTTDKSVYGPKGSGKELFTKL